MSPSDVPAAPQVTAVRVVSTCGTIDAFVSLFGRLFDVDQMWILTPQVMATGSRLAVLFTLSDGEAALSFTGDVLKAFPPATPTPYGRPGMLVKILSVPPASRPVMQRLHEASAEFGQSTRVAVGGEPDREPASMEDMESDVETVEPTEQPASFGGPSRGEIFSASFRAKQRVASDTVPQPVDMKVDARQAPPPASPLPFVELTPVVMDPVPAPEPGPEAQPPEPAPEAVVPAAVPASSRPPWPAVIVLVLLAFLAGYWLG